MKTTKRHTINEQYSAIVEIDGVRILIWIEEKSKWLWFDNFKRVSWVKLYHLGNDDSYCGCTLNGVFAGRVMSLEINNRNMAKFNLKQEVDTLYA